MTIGIGALCERRRAIVLGADSRVQFRMTDHLFRIDGCQKIFDLPHSFFGITAASPDSQKMILEICMRMERIPAERLSLPLVERAIRQAQKHVGRPRHIVFNMHIIIAGFVRGFPLLCTVLNGNPPDFDLSPGHFVIGSGFELEVGAREIMWIRRQQTQNMSWQRTVFHVHESVRLARIMSEDFGPPTDYVVLRSSGIFRISPDCDVLEKWSNEFRDDSSPLDAPEFAGELTAACAVAGNAPAGE